MAPPGCEQQTLGTLGFSQDLISLTHNMAVRGGVGCRTRASCRGC